MTETAETLGFGGLVLAAGPSVRMGEPKQLLLWRGEPLVHRAARAAVEAGLWPVVVVVGACAEEVRAALAGLPVATVLNRDHAAGVSGSLRRGLARLGECAPSLAGAVILACDQPGVDAAHVAALAGALRVSGRPVAASTDGGALLVPALFSAALFPELRALDGDEGAERLLSRDPARVAPVPLAHGGCHVDTPEDWRRARLMGGAGS
ncbi:conserved hypothetical protein [Anaeromyxobacter dehalogenans 2CP-1]|uniref:MobA-like NTP transferase domain-containing protein n=1 Tax=Anaeromyxobacter dehalogenans (strain ATCC BAA-258 / DSM 21875 / 2CP-1) TaxID=455488 RepID=B8J9Y4_ANAD2|nr:nucleotidyltransferase family protein [Anaeromyxobacter dehalogenans]ACL63687.1 conserved hypothetical protein [Anaeromyxobacter dehalogenans 2CP-1]